MNTFTARFAALAALALAAVPVVAVGSANAQTVARITVSDLDFSRAEDVAVFNARVGNAQQQFCGIQKRTLTDAANCRDAVRAEVIAKLSRQQQLALGAAAPSTRG